MFVNLLSLNRIARVSHRMSEINCKFAPVEQKRRYFYTGFMCHQVIEKTLKAYWCVCLDVDKVSLYIEPILLESGEDTPIYREVMRAEVAV